MLGLLFLYYIGKSYYNLTLTHGKNNPWGYAILGVASYYASIFLGAFVVGIIFNLVSPETLESMPEQALGVLCIPFGLLGCWAVYKFIEKRWEKVYEPISDPNLLDENI